MTKTECSCPKCIKLCRHAPGWMMPEEARKAIAAGFAEKLMLDYWIRSEGNIYILGPAVRGCEANRAPNTDELFGDLPMFAAMLNGPPAKGVCTFFKENKCSIHTSGFKPRQCREVYGCNPQVGPGNTEMGLEWDNPEAQKLVREWMALVGLEERILMECT